MPAITLADAEAQLALWLAASTAVAGGQEYTIGTRTLKRVDAREIREQLEYWDGKVRQLSRGTTGMRIRGGTPT